jgi:hypothetical protein
MEITYKPVGINETAEWGDYDHLMQRWEGLGKSMAKNLIREMRDNKDFRDYVFNPTHKLVFINYEGFKSSSNGKPETGSNNINTLTALVS